MADNWHWMAPLAAVLALSVVNGLMRYAPLDATQRGILRFIVSIVERMALTTRRNSPGTFKLPGTRSRPPETIIATEAEEQVTPVERPEGK